MKSANVPIHAPYLVNSFGFFDDFSEFWAVATTGRWTSTSTNGTNAILTSGTTPSPNGGVLNLVPSNATPANNDAAYVSAVNTQFQLIADQSIYFEANIYYQEQNTSQANIFVGLGSGTVTNILQAGSAGPATTLTGAGIWKKATQTQWQTISSISTSQTITASKNTAGGAGWHKLGILIQPAVGGVGQTTANTLTVSYFMDDQQLMQNVTAGSSFYPIKDTYTFTSPVTTYMYPVVGVKNGATVSGGMEQVYIDYIQVWQKRAPNTNAPD